MASQSSTVSSKGVVRLAVGGAIGGLLTFYLIDPGMLRIDNGGVQSDNEALYLGAVIGAAIGTMLIFADEIQSPRALRMARNLLLGAFVGAIVGTIGVFCADVVFDPLARTRFLPLVVIGRVTGWAIMGAAAGICPGVVARSFVKIRQGALGGILGGAVGGILFDLIAMVTHTGSASRMVGFTVTGLAIGTAVGLIEELRKVCWLTVLTGGNEGRNFILNRPSTTLGRDEMVDVPMYGDSSILKQHAVIAISPSGVVLVTQPGAAALVNGAYMPQVALQDGDILEFGRHRLAFHNRHDAGKSAFAVPADSKPTQQLGPVYNGQPTIMNLGVPGIVSRVTVVQGPYMGSAYPLTNGAIIGRDERCDIPLIADTHLSRQHARFLLDGTNWVVEDGQSMNGLYVNGVRVGRRLLAPGDEISAGQTVLKVS